MSVEEIGDDQIGLEADKVAQLGAEQAISAASPSWQDATVRPVQAFRPTHIHIASSADDYDDVPVVMDVVETMTSDRERFDP